MHLRPMCVVFNISLCITTKYLYQNLPLSQRCTKLWACTPLPSPPSGKYTAEIDIILISKVHQTSGPHSAPLPSLRGVPLKPGSRRQAL